LNITVDPTTNRINTYGFAYDAAGNLTQTPDGKTYAYNSENRMSQGNEGTYYYDANGQRLASGSPGYTSTWYFHGPGGIEVSLISAPSGTSPGLLWVHPLGGERKAFNAPLGPIRQSNAACTASDSWSPIATDIAS